MHSKVGPPRASRPKYSRSQYTKNIMSRFCNVPMPAIHVLRANLIVYRLPSPTRKQTETSMYHFFFLAVGGKPTRNDPCMHNPDSCILLQCLLRLAAFQEITKQKTRLKETVYNMSRSMSKRPSHMYLYYISSSASGGRTEIRAKRSGWGVGVTVSGAGV